LPFSLDHSFLKRRLYSSSSNARAALLLEADLELREVEVLRVAEALEEEPVHDLGERLVAAADASVRRDVEDDRVGRDLLVDGLEQDLELLVARAVGEALGGRLARDGAIRDERPSILAKLDLPEPKKPETQMAMPSCRLVRCLAVRLEDAGVVRADRVRDDVLVDLVADDLFVGLVDLDDLFDATVDVVGEQGLDGRGRHRHGPQKIFGR
jgi:hypothetical protein